MKYIFKGRHSGIFYGECDTDLNKNLVIKNVRQILSYQCDGLFQLSLEGPSTTSRIRMTITIPYIKINDCIEQIPCSEEAIQKLDAVPEWRL